MSLWKPFRGNRTALEAVEKRDGYVYFCVDDGSLFFDYLDAEGVLQRKQLNAQQAETLMGTSLEELKNEFTEQDVVILQEAQLYTDAAVEAVSDTFEEAIKELDDVVVKSVNGELPNASGEINIKQLTRTTCTKDLFVGGARENWTYYPDGIIPLNATAGGTTKNTAYIDFFDGLNRGNTYYITSVDGSNYLFKVEVTEFDDLNNVLEQYDFDAARDLSLQTFSYSGEKYIKDHFTLFYTAKTKIDASNKTFSDGYAGTQRINFGAAGSADSYKEGVIYPSLGINTTSSRISIKLWWACGGDGRRMQVYVNTGYGKSRLEVSGTMVAHGQIDVANSVRAGGKVEAEGGIVSGGTLDMCGNDIINVQAIETDGSVTIRNEMSVTNSIVSGGKVEAKEGMICRGTLDMKDNDVKNVQSLTINGTLKGNGEVFSDKYKPATDNVGRLGFTDKRFAYGYINNLILSNTPAKETNVYIAELDGISKLYCNEGYWYYDTATEVGLPLILEGYDFIQMYAGRIVEGTTLTNKTYYRIITVDDNNHVKVLEESNSIDHVHIQAEYQNEDDTIKKDLNLITPEDGRLLHNGKPVATIEALTEAVNTEIANLVNSAPETLDTLGELATALTAHEDTYDALLETIGNKANTSDLATVATSGSYNDLTNVPTEFTPAEHSHTEYQAQTDESLTTESKTVVDAINEINTSTNYLLGKPTPGLNYTLADDGNSYICSRVGGLTEPNIIIANTYNGLPVTGIGYQAFHANSTIKSVVIPDSVTSIGDSAFEFCTNLVNIVIPSSVTSIGSSAFRGCNKLTTVTIPNGITSIGFSAFSDCAALKSVVIPDSVTTIGNGVFSNCSELTEIFIPNSVVNLEDNLFYGCNTVTIYCEAESKPESWSETWNAANRPVVWGFASGFISVNEKIDAIVIPTIPAVPTKVSAFENDAEYQTQSDDALKTSAKTIVDAINELNESSLSKLVQLDTWAGDNKSVGITEQGVHWSNKVYIETDMDIEADYEARVPIVAGEGITFTVDEENQVVKISVPAIGDISTALDSIIAQTNAIIGGN